MVAVCPPPTRPAHGIRAFFEEVVGTGTEDWQRFGCMTTTRPPNWPRSRVAVCTRVAEGHRLLEDAFTDHLRAGEDAGTYRIVDARAAASALGHLPSASSSPCAPGWTAPGSNGPWPTSWPRSNHPRPKGARHDGLSRGNRHPFRRCLETPPTPDSSRNLFTEDADFVNVVGLWWRTRAQIRDNHAYGFLSHCSPTL